MKSYHLHSIAVSTAHKIKRYIKDWGKAQKAAWLIVRLNINIEQVISFAKKETGEERKANAIYANLDTIEKGYVRFVEILETGLEQWRSFRIANLNI